MFGMDKLIQSMLDKKSPITKYDLKEYWLDIGCFDDYEKVQELYNTHFNVDK